MADPVGGVASRLKQRAFGVLYQLTRRDSASQASATDYMVALGMQLVDVLSVRTLLTSPEFNYETRGMRYLPIVDPWALGEHAFVTAFVSVLVMCCLAAVVHSQVKHNSTAPASTSAKALRAITKLIAGPLLVPLLLSLVLPFRCTSLPCSGLLGGVLAVLGAGSVAVTVPIVLVVEFMCSDTKPVPRRLTSKVHGMHGCAYALLRVLCVLTVLLPTALAPFCMLALIAGFILHAATISLQLPFFEPAMNCLQFCASTVYALLLGGGLLLHAMPDFNRVLLQCICLAVAMLLTGLPILRYRQLARKLEDIRPLMMDAVRSGNINISARWLSPTAGRHPNKAAIRANIHKMAKESHEVSYKEPSLPLQAGTLGSRRASIDINAPGTVFEGMSAYETELVVRAELAHVRHQQQGARSSMFSRWVNVMPSTLAIEAGMWLYSQAMQEFKDDAGDMGVIKLEYARFLCTYTAAIDIAMAALLGAQREKLHLGAEYQLYAWHRDLKAKRALRQRAAGKDSEGAADVLSTAEYGVQVRAAIHNHSKAAAEMATIFGEIQRNNLRAAEGGASKRDQEQLAAHVEKLVLAVTAAKEQYEALLAHSGQEAPFLMELYAQFARDVLNDARLASMYDTLEAEDGTSSRGGSTEGGYSVDSRGTSMRRFVPRKTTKDVTNMKHNYRRGITFLLLLFAVTFTYTHFFLVSATAAAHELSSTSRLELFTARLALDTRALSLLSAEGLPLADTANATVAHAELFATVLLDSFHHMPAAVAKKWDAEQLRVTMTARNQSTLRGMNTWEAAGATVVDAIGYAEEPVAQFSGDPRWRFVMDNVMQVVQPALQHITQGLHEEITTQTASYLTNQSIIMIMLAMWALAFGVASVTVTMTRMDNIQNGVTEVASLLSPLQLSAMRHKAQLARAKVKELEAQLEDVLQQTVESADRGMGHVHNFTYDADKDKDIPSSTRIASAFRSNSGEHSVAKVALMAAALPQAPVRFQLPEQEHGETPQLPGSASISSSDAGGSKGSGQHSQEPDAKQQEGDTKQQAEEAGEPGEAEAAAPSTQAEADDEAEMMSMLGEDLARDMAMLLGGGGEGGEAEAGSDAEGEAGDSAGSDAQKQAIARSVLRSAESLRERQAALKVSDSRPGSPAAGDGSAGGCPVMSSSSDSVRPGSSGGCPVPHGHRSSSAPSGSGCPVVHGQRSSSLGDHDESKAHSAAKGIARRTRTIARLSHFSHTDGDHDELGEGQAEVEDLPWVEPDLEDIVASVNCAIVCTTSVGVILFANRTFETLMGYSFEEVKGKNIKMIVPPGKIRDEHEDIMLRVARGGATAFVGSAGRQLQGLTKDGETVPLLVSLDKLKLRGHTFFVGCLADLRGQLAEDKSAQRRLSTMSEDEEDGEGGASGGSSMKQLVCIMVLLLTAAMVTVLLLPLAAFLLGHGQVSTLVHHSHEVRHSNRIMFLVDAIAFGCQEAAIGDNEVWTQAEAASKMQTWLHDLDRTWFGLRYGDEGLGVPGSTGLSAELDALHFGVLNAAGTEVGGIDTALTFFSRVGTSCVQLYSSGGTPALGPSQSALLNHTDASQLLAFVNGAPMDDLQLSSDMYRRELEHRTRVGFVTNGALCLVEVVVVVLIYIYTVKRIVRSLLHSARQMEVLLLVLPQQIAATGLMRKFYVDGEEEL